MAAVVAPRRRARDDRTIVSSGRVRTQSSSVRSPAPDQGQMVLVHESGDDLVVTCRSRMLSRFRMEPLLHEPDACAGGSPGRGRLDRAASRATANSAKSEWTRTSHLLQAVQEQVRTLELGQDRGSLERSSTSSQSSAVNRPRTRSAGQQTAGGRRRARQRPRCSDIRRRSGACRRTHARSRRISDARRQRAARTSAAGQPSARCSATRSPPPRDRPDVLDEELACLGAVNASSPARLGLPRSARHLASL